MKDLHFYKYQGTGNDFVMIDNREGVFDANDRELVIRLCDRKFGIGADGLILIQPYPGCDFEMVYFNADATQSMCGNGSRCAVRFAHALNIIGDHCTFMAIDGLHEAVVNGELIKLKMGDVTTVRKINEEDYFVDTGSPHHIRFVEELKTFPVYEEGKFIRYSEVYKKEGTNVNFVARMANNILFVRTYERGVEHETLSCGTGVTACSIAASFSGYTSPVKVETLGGKLEVSFERNEDGTFKEVYLIGPAKAVFKGTIKI